MKFQAVDSSESKHCLRARLENVPADNLRQYRLLLVKAVKVPSLNLHNFYGRELAVVICT